MPRFCSSLLVRRRGWPLLGSSSLLILLSTCNAQSNISITSYSCTVENAAECLNEWRICYQEECGACIEGYVEIPEEPAQEDSLKEHDSASASLLQEDTTNDIQQQQTVCVRIAELELALYDKKFQPLYSNQDTTTELEASRYQILQEVAAFVSQHNSQILKPTYTLGINQFSADTPQEAQRLGGYQVPEDGSLVLAYLVAQQLQEQGSSAIPARLDWVDRGAVTSVKDQGRCGGCWSISVAGAIEGAAFLTSNYLQSLSFQQLISCDKSNGGCNGGFPAKALVYANENKWGGTATLNDYQFTDGNKGETTEECSISDYPIAVDSEQGYAITYYGAVGDDTYEVRMAKMKQGVSRQPVAIAVKSECPTFKNYKSGVLTDDGDCSCKPSDVEGCLDHAVLLVGFDDDPSNGDPPYWKIKNSWGQKWGEDGFVRIAQFNPQYPNPNSWGLFGLLAEGVVPLKASNYTEQVYDEPQELGGMQTWQKVLIAFGAFVGAAIVGVGLAILANKLCSKK